MFRTKSPSFSLFLKTALSDLAELEVDGKGEKREVHTTALPSRGHRRSLGSAW